MEDPTKLVTDIVEWAEQDERISAVIQTGSRGRGDRVDDYSDLDIEIITPHWQALYDDQSWIERFGDVLLCVSFDDEDDEPAPVLVVYAGGRKVDFTVAGEERITDMVGDGLDELYQRGYHVHLDRAGITADLPAPTGEPDRTPAPDLDEFTEVVEEFFFEATQVPIYLNRGELWVAKVRDHTMKECLLRMLEWHAATDPAGPRHTWYIGHHMDEWVPASYWQRVHETFGRFDAQDSRRALDESVALFADVAEEVAARLGFPSRADLAEGVRRLLDNYRRLAST